MYVYYSYTVFDYESAPYLNAQIQIYLSLSRYFSIFTHSLSFLFVLRSFYIIGLFSYYFYILSLTTGSLNENKTELLSKRRRLIVFPNQENLKNPGIIETESHVHKGLGRQKCDLP